MHEAIRKAEVLIEALSYIRRFRDRLTVIKLGGSAMEDADALRATLQDVVFMETVGMRPVLVHGGGKPIDRAMAAAGLGLAFMPRLCVNHPGVVARPLVAPEFWREVSLVTVRGRPHSPALGAMVTEAMHARWADQPALAVQAARAFDLGADDDPAARDRPAQ